MLLAWTAIKLTFVTTISRVTGACQTVTLPMSRTFTVTTFACKAWVTFTEATVWRILCTIYTRLVTSLAHPPRDAVCAAWGVKGAVTYPMTTTVEARTIEDFTTLGRPARVTGADMDSSVTYAMTSAIKSVSCNDACLELIVSLIFIHLPKQLATLVLNITTLVPNSSSIKVARQL